ncbi:MAG TPA: hypothetical protein PKX01_16340, partial [Rhodocyclaceae bacterium]|nr:hypothetical protein [Rhodocyclaceae bacterium]
GSTGLVIERMSREIGRMASSPALSPSTRSAASTMVGLTSLGGGGGGAVDGPLLALLGAAASLAIAARRGVRRT